MDINEKKYKKIIKSYIDTKLKKYEIEIGVYDCVFMSVQISIVYIIKQLIMILKGRKKKKATMELLDKLHISSDLKDKLMNAIDNIEVDCGDMIYDIFMYLLKDGNISKHVIERVNIVVNHYLNVIVKTTFEHLTKDNITEKDMNNIIEYSYPEEIVNVVNVVSVSEFNNNSNSDDNSDSFYKDDKSEAINMIDEDSENLFDLLDENLEKEEFSNIETKNVYGNDISILDIVSTFKYNN